MNSVWTETITSKNKQTLKDDLETDVLIIGGGLAGILCAYELKNAGVNCTLVEAKRICDGITKNTTAKITAQHGLIYHSLIKKFGVEKAALYLKANLAAVEKYRKLCKNIDCDFEEKPSFVYSTDDPDVLEKEVRALERLEYSAKFVSNPPLPFPVVGAVGFDRQAQFHPLKFAYRLAKDLPIFENTKVLQLAPYTAITANARIRAKKIIVATHFPFLNKHGFYFLKMFQHRSYVLSLKNAQLPDGMYVDEKEKGLSFRSYGDLLLLGGGSHRTGEKGGNWTELKAFAKKYYPSATVESQWATQDCMTLDGVPYVGQYSRRTPDLYVTTGFNKWGFTSSMVAAELLKDLILERNSPYAEVFSPSRTMLRARLAVNAAKSVVNLLTPTTPRCPHLGCALKYNPQERSWDCPCHGSRFTEEKKLLDNPATGDIK